MIRRTTCVTARRLPAWAERCAMSAPIIAIFCSRSYGSLSEGDGTMKTAVAAPAAVLAIFLLPDASRLPAQAANPTGLAQGTEASVLTTYYREKSTYYR